MKQSAPRTSGDQRRFAMLLLILFIAIFPSIACKAASEVIYPSTPTPTPQPTPTKIWLNIEKDTFDANRYQWPEASSITKKTTIIEDVKDGKYKIDFALPENGMYFAYPQMPIVGDFKLSTDVQQTGGNKFAGYGLLFRAAENSNYFFAITSHESYYLAIMQDEEWEYIIPPTFAKEIKMGAVNTLTVEAVQDTITLLINRQVVNQVTDDRLTEGWVGVAFGLDYAGSAQIEFDNFDLFTNASPLEKLPSTSTPTPAALETSKKSSDIQQ